MHARRTVVNLSAPPIREQTRPTETQHIQVGTSVGVGTVSGFSLRPALASLHLSFGVRWC